MGGPLAWLFDRRLYFRTVYADMQASEHKFALAQSTAARIRYIDLRNSGATVPGLPRLARTRLQAARI
jgi:hypothetical protein